MIIYLQDRRLQAADLLTKLQHVFGGFPLLFIGLRKIVSSSPEWPMAIVEVAIGGLVVLTFIRELRQTLRSKEHEHPSAWHTAIGWFDLAAGGLLIFEAFHQPHVKPGYLRPQFLSGTVAIGLGIFQGRFHGWRNRRRYLKLDANGMQCRLSPFRRFSLAWTELESVEISDKEATFKTKEGQQRTIRTGLYNNANEIRSAISDHARAAGLLASGEEKRDQVEAVNPGTQPII